jgi:hypothetical protein
MTGEILRNLEPDKPGAATPPASMIDALTAIWQRVLQRPHIGPEEEFHDLGGSDPLADKIFTEIEQTFHRELPAATICHAPTIAALASLLQLPELPQFPPFVKLKAGSGKTQTSRSWPGIFEPTCRFTAFRRKASTGWKSPWAPSRRWLAFISTNFA